MSAKERVTISKLEIAEIVETLKDVEAKLEGLSK